MISFSYQWFRHFIKTEIYQMRQHSFIWNNTIIIEKCALLCMIECSIFAFRLSIYTYICLRKEEETCCSYSLVFFSVSVSFHSLVLLVSSYRFFLLLFFLTTVLVLVAACSAIDDNNNNKKKRKKTRFLTSFEMFLWSISYFIQVLSSLQ